MSTNLFPPDAARLIEDLAASCARYVTNAIGTTPDSTGDTLPFIDHWLGSLEDTPRSEVMSLIVPAAGAYLGEVIRKHFGRVRWRFDGENYEKARLEFENVFLSFNPFALALEAVLGEDVPGWGSELQLLARDHDTVTGALDNVGEVSDEDYYRLTMRFENIEHVVSVLEALASARKETNVFLGPDVYGAERGEHKSELLH